MFFKDDFLVSVDDEDDRKYLKLEFIKHILHVFIYEIDLNYIVHCKISKKDLCKIR